MGKTDHVCRPNALKQHRLNLRCCFSFFYCALVADIEAGTAQNTFGLVNFIGNAHIDAAFRAQKGTASAGNTPVGNEIVLLVIHG